MFTFIIILLIVVSFLLGAVVLVQNSKGGGLAAGLSASNQVMGVRKTTDFLEKLTWIFAVLLIVLALVGNLFLPRNASTGEQSVIEDQLNDMAVPTAPAPGAPAPAGQPATPAQPAQ